MRLGKESNAHCCGLQAGNWQWLMTKLQATPVSFNWNKLKLQLVLISLSRGYGLCVSELWDWIGLDWTGLDWLGRGEWGLLVGQSASQLGQKEREGKGLDWVMDDR